MKTICQIGDFRINAIKITEQCPYFYEKGYHCRINPEICGKDTCCLYCAMHPMCDPSDFCGLLTGSKPLKY